MVPPRRRRLSPRKNLKQTVHQLLPHRFMSSATTKSAFSHKTKSSTRCRRRWKPSSRRSLKQCQYLNLRPPHPPRACLQELRPTQIGCPTSRASISLGETWTKSRSTISKPTSRPGWPLPLYGNSHQRRRSGSTTLWPRTTPQSTPTMSLNQGPADN